MNTAAHSSVRVLGDKYIKLIRPRYLALLLSPPPFGFTTTRQYDDDAQQSEARLMSATHRTEVNISAVFQCILQTSTIFDIYAHNFAPNKPTSHVYTCARYLYSAPLQVNTDVPARSAWKPHVRILARGFHFNPTSIIYPPPHSPIATS